MFGEIEQAQRRHLFEQFVVVGRKGKLQDLNFMTGAGELIGEGIDDDGVAAAQEGHDGAGHDDLQRSLRVAGTPIITEFGSMGRMTTPPAPTVAQEPIFTPGIALDPAARNAPSPTVTLPAM